MVTIKKSVKSIVSNWLGFFSHVVISFISTPIILYSLGDSRYGVWSLIISVTGTYRLLNFGMRSSLTKHVAEYNARGDADGINKLINSSFTFFLPVAVVVLLITSIVSLYFTEIFIVENVDLKVISTVVMLVGLNICLGFVFKPFDVILVAFNRFDIANTLGVIFSILRISLIILVLKRGLGLVSMAIVILSISIINYGFITMYSKKIFKKLSLRFKYVNKQSLKVLFNFGAFNFMRDLSRLVLHRTDLILVGIFLGPSSVAVYGIAESLIRYASSMVKGITRVVLPLTSGLGARGQVEKIRKIMLIIPKYVLLFSVFVGIQFYFLGEQFIQIWMGEGYYQTYVIFCVLMVARIGISTHETMIASVVGMGHNRFLGYLSLFEMVTNITLSIVFVKVWGLVGVALGTVIPLTITRSFIVPIYCCRLVEINYETYFRKVIFPTLVSIVPCILVTYFTVSFIQPNTYLKLIINTMMTSFFVLIFFYRFLEPELKHILKSTSLSLSMKVRAYF